MSSFAEDVISGLQSTPKKLSSKYFYDKKGDALFQKIMTLEEYYLTRKEYQIFCRFKEQIVDNFCQQGDDFKLVEFGAGDGYKTKVLLSELIAKGIAFTYVPIDISGNALDKLKASLNKEMPALKVRPIQDEYFNALKQLKNQGQRLITMFLGSNIGNFTHEQALLFLKQLGQVIGVGDMLFIGFDLKKNPDTILAAYNDKKNVTRDFNLNLLTRINRELNGNFNLEKFKHFPIYSPLTGTAQSFLLSTEQQQVNVADSVISFDQWEPIHMEISQKFDLKEIEKMASLTGFSMVDTFVDHQHYFADVLWQKI